MTHGELTPSGEGPNPPLQIAVWKAFHREKYPDGMPRLNSTSDEDFLAEFTAWAEEHPDLVEAAGMVCPHGVTEVCCVLCHAAGRHEPLASPYFAGMMMGDHTELRLPLCRGHAEAAREIWYLQMESPEMLNRLRRETEEH